MTRWLGRDGLVLALMGGALLPGVWVNLTAARGLTWAAAFVASLALFALVAVLLGRWMRHPHPEPALEAALELPPVDDVP